MEWDCTSQILAADPVTCKIALESGKKRNSGTLSSAKMFSCVNCSTLSTTHSAYMLFCCIVQGTSPWFPDKWWNNCPIFTHFWYNLIAWSSLKGDSRESGSGNKGLPFVQAAVRLLPRLCCVWFALTERYLSQHGVQRLLVSPIHIPLPQQKCRRDVSSVGRTSAFPFLQNKYC